MEGDSYDELLLIQKSPITAYYEERKAWPTRSTNSYNSQISKNSCLALFKPNFWIVRGLWPHKYNGASPISCVKYTEGYVRSSINSDLWQRLEENWAYFIRISTIRSFWEFEWFRYGSCITDIDGMNTVDRYFDKALKLADKYNIGKILQTYGIVSGQNYTADNIYDVIEFNYQVKPRMKCFLDYNPQQPEQYLSEVTLCFNRTLNLVDCYYNGLQHCNGNKTVIYPTIKNN